MVAVVARPRSCPARASGSAPRRPARCRPRGSTAPAPARGRRARTKSSGDVGGVPERRDERGLLLAPERPRVVGVDEVDDQARRRRRPRHGRSRVLERALQAVLELRRAREARCPRRRNPYGGRTSSAAEASREPNVKAERRYRAGRMQVAERRGARAAGRSPTRGCSPRRSETAWLHTDPWRALRILSEFVEGFDAMARVGRAVAVFGVGPHAARATATTRSRRRSASALAKAGLRGHHRRRAGDHGGRQPRRARGRRVLGRLQHRAARTSS